MTVIIFHIMLYLSSSILLHLDFVATEKEKLDFALHTQCNDDMLLNLHAALQARLVSLLSTTA
jgi:hypothetical protein